MQTMLRSTASRYAQILHMATIQQECVYLIAQMDGLAAIIHEHACNLAL